MLGFPSRKTSQTRTGLVHTTATRAVAIVHRRDGGLPRLAYAASAGRARGMLAWRATQLLLQSAPERRSRVSAVLDTQDYQLLQTESLDLEAGELRSAIRWKIREQLVFAAEDAVIDIFQLPEVRGVAGTLQVVATPPTAITEIETIVHDTARELDVIDIPELALRNLMALMPQDNTGCLFVMLGRSMIYILISYLGVLHVVRRIDAAIGADAGQLALELQRSMQYYESQFDRAPIGTIVLGPANARTRDLAAPLAEACGVACEVLDLARLLDCAPGLPDMDQPELVLAVGAALRAVAAGRAS